MHAKFVTAAQLRSRAFGHNIESLAEAAVDSGLVLDDEDQDVLRLMTSDALMRSRYIKSGFYTWATIEALDRTARSLRKSVGSSLRESGVLVRNLFPDALE